MLALADALEGGRLSPPFGAFGLQRIVAAEAAGAVGAELDRLTTLSVPASGLAATLRLLAEERAHAQAGLDATELVWTGPEVPGAQSRDTAVVVRDLFARAERSVLVAGFAVYQGKDVFRVLGERMEALPSLSVRMFLNVARRDHDDRRPAATVLAEFAEDFRRRQWPGNRMPEVFFDPRSVAVEPHDRAALHAKVIVVDSREVLVTSANFTEAAQQRNIEAGVRLSDATLARALAAQFEGLVASGELGRVPEL